MKTIHHLLIKSLPWKVMDCPHLCLFIILFIVVISILGFPLHRDGDSIDNDVPSGTNIAIENGTFIVDLPNKNGDFP